MVGNQHDFIFESDFRPLQQRRFILEYIARNHQQAITIFQAQPVETIAQQRIDLLCKTGITICNIILINIDQTQILNFIGIRGFEKAIQSPV